MAKTKVNLGSGTVLLKGFLNVDMYDRKDVGPGRYLKADVRSLPLKPDSVDYILASQVLEHLPIRDLEGAVNEWLRVLKPGGRMVITCPDFTQQCAEWLLTPFTVEDYFNLAEGMFGNQLSEGEYHRAPITPHVLQYLIAGKVSDGKIHIIKKGDPMRVYPGYGEKNRIYRFGEVHLDVTK